MKTYKIELQFTDPYIGSRNGGNKIIAESLTLKQAQKQLLDLFNDKTEHYTLTWAEAKRKTKRFVDSATGRQSSSRFSFDGRIYKITPQN